MISQVIDIINERVCKCLCKGVKTYGLTQLMKRDNITIPAVIDITGEGTEVVVDDSLPGIVYHRQISITGGVAQSRPGYGDDQAAFTNSYSMAMFIYFDRFKTKLTQEELYLKIQATINFQAQGFTPFSLVQVQVTSAVLKDGDVWNAEYSGNTEFRLPPNAHFMQINYSISSTFRTNCFDCNDETPSEITILPTGGGGGGRGPAGPPGPQGEPGPIGPQGPPGGGSGTQNLFIQETDPALAISYLWIETNPDDSIKTFWVNVV